MIEINFPLFVRAKDSGEVSKFASIRELQVQVERIDIENQEYEAWDRNGLPVCLRLQDPPIWIKLEFSTEGFAADRLRHALREFANSVGVELSDQLPVSEFESAMELVRTEQEKKMLANSRIRRFFARAKHPLEK